MDVVAAFVVGLVVARIGDRDTRRVPLSKSVGEAFDIGWATALMSLMLFMAAAAVLVVVALIWAVITDRPGMEMFEVVPVSAAWVAGAALVLGAAEATNRA